MKNIFFKALTTFICGLFSIFLLIFLPAGTFKYFGGILFMLVLFIPMLVSGTVMLYKSPSLLESRLDFKEKQKGQSSVIFLSGIMFILGFISAGLDFRFNISRIPMYLQFSASIVFLVGYLMYFIILSQNKFLSRTIKVMENQTVIDTGLYSIIRHPMYTSTIIMFLSMPLILGSYISLIIFSFYPVIIVKRIKLEEEFLENNILRYAEYKSRVKYKLIPYIW